MKKTASPLRRTGKFFLPLLLLLVLVPFLPVLWSGGDQVLSLKSADLAQQFYAYKDFTHQEIRQGRLPLWNPYLMSGTDFHGEGQPALFYPPTWLLSLFSPATAINLYFLLHAWLLGAALYFYLRELGLTRESSFLGSLVFVFSSASVLRIFPGHYPNFPSLALAPLFLLLWERFLKDRGGKHLLLLSLVYACLVLAGHAQSLFYFSLFFLFYVLWCLATLKEASGKEKGKRFLAFVISLLLGVLLSSVHLFPAWDFAQNSFRHRMTYEFCSMFSFAPENFLTLLYPALFGDRVTSVYWGRNYLWEMTAYLGVIPLLFAALGALYGGHSRKVLFLAAAALFSLLALGNHTPLFSLLYHFVPAFDKFRGSSKFMTLAVFSLSVLAAFGFELLFAGARAKSRKAQPSSKGVRKTGMILSLAVALISAIVFWSLSDARNWNSFVQWRLAQGETFEKFDPRDEKTLRAAQGVARQSAGWTGLLALGAAFFFIFLNRKRPQDLSWGKWLLLAGILADLFWFGWKYFAVFSPKDFQPPPQILEALSREKELFRVLAPSMPPNSFMPSRIESMGGYAGNVLERYNRFLSRTQGMAEENLHNYVQVNKYPPAFHLLNIRYLILPAKIRVETPDFHPLLSAGDLNLYQNRAFIPRVYFPRKVRFVDSPGEALALAARGDTDPRDWTVLENPLRKGEEIDYGEARGEVKLLKYAPNWIRLEVQTTRPRFLVLANSFDPRWEASIDERNAVPVVPANYVLQAIQVPEGAHQVTFYFFPNSLRWGILLSALGLVVWVLLWLGGKHFPKIS